MENLINKIHHSECKEFMRQIPDKAIDLILTDPPYGLGTTNFGPAHRYRRKEKSWNNRVPGKEVFDEIYRISKNQIIWGCNYFINNIQVPGRIVHYKGNEKEGYCIKTSPCDLASQSFNNRIEFFNYLWDGNRQGDGVNWKNEGLDARIHPTQKPIALMTWCLNEYTKENDLICDCYSGSGTTAIACHKLNRRFICIEKELEYVTLSRQRLKDCQAQQDLFNNKQV